MRLETPYGVIGLHARGSGRLDDGFSGRVVAVAEKLDLAGCAFGRGAAMLQVSIAAARPTRKGPLSAGPIPRGHPPITGARRDKIGKASGREQGGQDVEN